MIFFPQATQKNVAHNSSTGHWWCPAYILWAISPTHKRLLQWRTVILCLGAGNTRNVKVLMPLEAALKQDGWGWVSGYPVSLDPGWDRSRCVFYIISQRCPCRHNPSSSHDNLPHDYHSFMTFLSVSFPPHNLCFLESLLKYSTCPKSLFQDLLLGKPYLRQYFLMRYMPASENLPQNTAIQKFL